MHKKIRAGTRINETVDQVEKALDSNDSVTLEASGNAISKAITIAEIVKRNTSTLRINNRLFRAEVDTKDKEPAGEAEDEEGRWRAVQTTSTRKFIPCLEIILSHHE